MKPNRKIVIIGPAHPLRGGIATFNERLARQFQQEGDQVTIFTFSLQYPSFLFPGTTQFSSETIPKDLSIRVCINSINPFNWIRVGLHLKKMNPDFILVRYWLPFMGPCLGSILHIAKSNKKTRVICIADNITPHEKRIGDHLFTSFFVTSADAFVTMSENVFKDLRKFERSKPALTIPHPLFDNFGDWVDKKEARHFLQLPADHKIILFFGFIRKYKGLDILISAMSDERIKKSGILLMVAGEFYQNKESYIKQIEELGLKNNIILRTQFISDNEVKYYCCSADLIVQPYRNATQSGVTPLAYHFEKPMVVTNVGGLAKMIEDGKSGLVAEPTPQSLADHIIEFFELGETHFLPYVRLQKQKLSWSSFTTSIRSLYDKINSEMPS